LLTECGPPLSDGKKTGAIDKIKAVVEFLAENGFDYSVGRLRHLRIISYRFTETDRSPNYSWNVHYVAGSP